MNNNKKLFSGSQGLSKVVTIVPLSSSIDAKSVVTSIIGSVDQQAEVNSPGITSVYLDRFKQNLTFVIPPASFLAIIDSAKVADFVVFALSATEEVDKFGELCIRTIESQGVSSVFSVISNLNDVDTIKKQTEVKSSLSSYFSHFFPSSDKPFTISNSAESLNLCRSLCQKYPKGINWRDERPYILADKFYWQDDSNSENGGYLAVEGVVRGKGIDPNRLIHIPDFGDFQVAKIAKRQFQRHSVLKEDISNESEFPDSSQDDVDPFINIDADMMSDEEEYDMTAEPSIEQGVRLDDHLYFRDEYKEDLDQKLKSRKIPKGMSSYQARWILDDDEFSDEDISDNEEMEDENGEGDFGISKPVASEYEPTDAGEIEMDNFVDLAADEEELQLKEFRQRARDNLDFPDEIELSPTVSAKDRMIRYRGLKNLRSCTWDADEKDSRAPEEWKRLLRVANYKGTRTRVLKESLQNARIDVGTPVTIFIKCDRNLVELLGQAPLILYGLLQYENKMVVLNFAIQQSTEYEEPIAAKETLIIQCGPRRYTANPIFSQAGKSSNNVYKYQRFIYPGESATATVIAPIMFGNVPTLFFKKVDQELRLAATGSIFNADHSRILAKRSVLTGHPFKIHKRVVTIRYMFFNRDDIMWFKAVPLFTRMGNSGYIKEPLGTHGYFKATFDRKIHAQDTVAMALYKRVWPRVATLWDGNI